MITLHNTSALDMNRLILYGLKEDTKPIEYWLDKSISPAVNRIVGNGSMYVEINGQKRYLYDATNKKWEEAPSGGGSGGDVPEEDIATDSEIDDMLDDIIW